MDGVDSGCPLVLVEWADSVRPEPSWGYLADFECGEVVRCISVGWLVHDGEEVKAVAPNMGCIDDEDTLQVSGVIRIPARSVSRIVRLAEVG